MELGKALTMCALTIAVVAGARPAFADVDVSHTGADVAAAVPMIALDPAHPRRVLIAWRSFTMPLRDNIPAPGGKGVCYLSISDDAGAHFRTIAPPLTSVAESCNAPWVAVAGKAIVVGGTITGKPVAPGMPHSGLTQAGLMRSTDDGRSWGPRVAAIGSEEVSRFVLRDGIDPAKMRSAHDGARGVHDAASGALFVSGAHPEPPNSASNSQRYVTASRDGGQSFGPIRGFDSAEWPGRWDGDLAVGKGALGLSYVGGAVPNGAACPCAVFGLTRDDGATITRSLVAPAAEFSMADLVHVPALAGDPLRAGHYAIGLIGADNASTRIYRTSDGGGHWQVQIPVQPAGVVKVTRVGVAIAPDGTTIAAWRGAFADGHYDLFAAAARLGAQFAPAGRISTASSRRPATVPATGFEGGDFVSWVSADTQAAHFAWADARDGTSVRVFYARVPLADLGKDKP